jgi:hypothetical protein
MFVPEPLEFRKNIVDAAFQAPAARVGVMGMRQRFLELRNLGGEFPQPLPLRWRYSDIHDLPRENYETPTFRQYRQGGP